VTLKEIAERLGTAAGSLASLATLRIEAVRARTRADLLEVARWLDIKGASKLRKNELAACVLEGLKERASLARARAGKIKEAAEKAAQAARSATPARAVTAVKAAKAAATSKVEKAAKAAPPAKAAAPAKAPRIILSEEVPPTEKLPAPEKATAPPKAKAAAPSRPAPAARKAPAARPPAEPEDAALREEEDPSGTAKLDLGPAGKAGKPVEHIPWGYGQDRVVAAAVDPDRLYVYWEVTNAAMERARAGLGPGGPGAWLNLRVHDTSGILFDGANAHTYFDHQVDRSDRQWFFQIGKPTSSAHVEIGMRSSEGYFVRIARSGRVDFPRKESAPWQEPEWLTVLPATGEVRHAGTGTPAHLAGAGPGAPVGGGAPPPGAPLPPPFAPIALWRLHETGENREARIAELLAEGWERVEWHEVEGEGWYELQGRAEWMGPVFASSWHAGPFTYPVDVEPPMREEWHGPTITFRIEGVTHVIHGPWQVVIRNLDAHREHQVLGRWEIYRSWVTSAGAEARPAALPGGAATIGASETLGGSERRWLSGSELRLGGASEVWRLGASELRLGGASELVFAGASQWSLGGASERRFQGASELRLAGGSERRLGGASEQALQGASEHRLGGSEGRLAPVIPGSGYPKVEE
jgi:hypothetical protein